MLIASEKFGSLPLLALILVNLSPVIGVLWLDWDVAAIVILYWLENIVIGFYSLVKILQRNGLPGIFHTLFFCIHFGGFCGAHGLFIFALLGGDELQDALFPKGDEAWPAFLVFPQMLFIAIRHVLEHASPGVLYAWAGLFVSHGISLALNYFQQGEYRHATIKTLMSAPYKRIAILHVAIIAGAWGVLSLGSPLSLLLALIAVNIVIDVYLHRRSHGRQARAEATVRAGQDTSQG